MSVFPKHLLYSDDHYWLEVEDENNVRVGLTAYGVEQMGQALSVTLPKEGATVEAGSECGELETEDKGVLEIVAPISGEIQAVNADLAESPALLNEDPYQDGWLFVIGPSDPKELKEFKAAAEYKERVEALEAEEG